MQISNETLLAEGWTRMMWYAQKNYHRQHTLVCIEEMTPMFVQALAANAHEAIMNVIE